MPLGQTNETSDFYDTAFLRFSIIWAKPKAGGVCEAGDAAGARSVPGCSARRAHVVRNASSLVCDVATNMAVSDVSAAGFFERTTSMFTPWGALWAAALPR